MSDEILQSKLESDAKKLPALRGPETRGFRAEDQFPATNPPPSIPPPNIPGLDMGKPEIGGSCPVCGLALPVDATLKNTAQGMFYCCRACNPNPPMT